MKTILKLFAAGALLAGTVSGCAVYATPYGPGVAVAPGYYSYYEPAPPAVVVAPSFRFGYRYRRYH